MLTLAVLPADEAHLSLERIRAWTPPGSAPAISHIGRDGPSPEAVKKTDQIVAQSTAVRVFLRSRMEIENLFTGLELMAPLDDLGNWRSDEALPLAAMCGVVLRA